MEQLAFFDNGNWKEHLLKTLSVVSRNTPFASAFRSRSVSVGVHLAVFIEPYLSLLLGGKKTVESRFSINRHAPFKQVQSGDILVLKRAGGPICGLCRVAEVQFYRVNPDTWLEIERYAKALCMDDSEFWAKKKTSSFATLMQIEDVCKLEEFDIDKEDPRSWVVVQRTPRSGQRMLTWYP
jgi:hypothetical protein